MKYIQLLLSLFLFSGILCFPRNPSAEPNNIDDGFIVSLYTSNTSTKVCAGSIINEKWILTAGECVERISGQESYITVGNTEVAQTIVKRAIKHPHYVRFKTVHNIGLLCLQRPLVFDSNIKSLGIPRQYIIPSGTGYIIKTDPQSKQLVTVDLPIISKVVCLMYYEFINESQVCAGEEKMNSCPDYVGSPLLQNQDGKEFALAVEKEDGREIAVGIHVLPNDACARSVPNAFVRISRYTNWIKETIEKGDC